ncbi:MAG: sel1 repeat family protein [Pararhodobacter sp.]|nr:sel1 repeat family protein [Pararhodobacter sp.]
MGWISTINPALRTARGPSAEGTLRLNSAKRSSSAPSSVPPWNSIYRQPPLRPVPPCHDTVTPRARGARAALALGALLAGGLVSSPAWPDTCDEAAREWRQLEGVTSRLILQAFIDRHPDCPAAVAPARAQLASPDAPTTARHCLALADAAYVSGAELQSGDPAAAVAACRAAHAAEPQDARVAAALGRALVAIGQGDEAEIETLLRQGAEGDRVDAMSNYAILLRRRGGAEAEAEAVRWYRRAAEAGEETAMMMLGWHYQNGRSVAQDTAQAIRWYRDAAERGNAQGALRLAQLLAQGHGGADGRAEATHWYRVAAVAGEPAAMAELGFRLGRATKPDPEAAADWLMRARASGDDRIPPFIADNLDRLPEATLRALQHRLYENGEYAGALDGRASPTLRMTISSTSN